MIGDSSEHWIHRITTWIEHCQRHTSAPAALLLSCQDPLWLQTLRALAGSFERFGSIDAGATRTRGGPGKPIRYLGPWHAALDFRNPARDKAQTRATALKLWTACWHGRFQGISLI